MTSGTHKRRAEALRRLGGELPKPDPKKRCAYHFWSQRDQCNEQGIRMRRDWQNAEKWYCARHDPFRIEAEARNRKKRLDEKKARWRELEQERKAGHD